MARELKGLPLHHIDTSIILEPEITEDGRRISPLDAQIVACAIENKANLVTLDRKLIGNIAVEKEFSIKIFHPKNLP